MFEYDESDDDPDLWDLMDAHSVPAKGSAGDVEYFRLCIVDVLRDESVRVAYKSIFTETASEHFEQLEKTMCCLKNDRSDKHSTIEELSKRLGNLEQYVRGTNLMGIEETQHESTDRIILDASSEIGVDLTLQDVQRSSRVGPNVVDDVNVKSGPVVRHPLKKRRTSLENHIDEFRARRIRKADNKDSCTACLKATLHCYNVFVLILACGCLGVGIWLLVTEYNAREMSVLFDSKFFEIATYLLVGGGGFIALLAFCGCCGTLKTDKCVLGFYAFTLIVVFLALIVGSALAFASRDVIIEKIKEKFRETISGRYGTDIRTNSDNRLITDAWDSMQKGLKCCGVSGDVNSTESWAIFKLQSQWYTNQKLRYPYVPKSCCADNDNGLCDGTKDLKGPPMWGPPMKQNHKKNPYLYTEGCFDVAYQYLKSHAVILGIIAATIPIFLLIGIFISCCLCMRVRKDHDIDDEETDL